MAIRAMFSAVAGNISNILGESAKIAQPRKRAFDHPAFWQNRPFAFDFFRDVQGHVEYLSREINGRATITGITRKSLERQVFIVHTCQYVASTLGVAEIGRVYFDVQ